MTQTREHVSEIVTYRLNAGVDPAQFVADARGLAPYLERTGGMLARTLCCDADGLWTEHVTWVDQEAAQRASAGFARAPEAAPLMAQIDAETVSMRHGAIQLNQTG